MANAANIFNNTILIPTSGSPEKAPEATLGTELQKYSKKIEETAIKTGGFRVFLNIGGTSIPMKYCESVYMLEVRREAESQRSGGNGDYIAKLPGQISYSPVTFTHFYCTNDAFMNWLINGIDQGGIQTANIEIKVGQETNHMVYTLRDAFPINWSLGTFSVDLEGAGRTGELVAYMINQDQILCENLTVAYSKMEYDHETSSWGN
ncbi:MAG: phage tail protein [Anaerolineaceae bacterium]|nr:phage tail protein [Anaerolineaceae bacterium]